jgi:hypothetical protein
MNSQDLPTILHRDREQIERSRVRHIQFERNGSRYFGKISDGSGADCDNVCGLSSSCRR